YEIDAKQKGMLIEFESWNRHWRLRVNGEKGDIYKAFGIFRGIMIEPGKNVIELKYTVPYFRELFWLSVFILCIYGVALIKVLHDGRRPRGNHV
ncbi:MAG: YfhO family protein, partial [Nitrospirae bacterium]|nr:YfhO family protein [Nitrospirota bacterium]